MMQYIGAHGAHAHSGRARGVAQDGSQRHSGGTTCLTTTCLTHVFFKVAKNVANHNDP